MRCLSTKSVSLATVVAISLVLVSLPTSADDDPLVDDPFGNASSAQPAVDPPVVLTEEESASESTPSHRLWVGDRDPDRTEQILKILESDLTSHGLDFQDTSLEEVITFLRDEYSIEIQIDATGLDELGIGPDEPVTVNVCNMKLGAALRFMLKPLELTHVIQDGVLIITSEDEAFTMLSIAVYPVEDLLADKPDWEALVDTIVATVESDTWAKNGGGEAEIRPYPQRSALVICQTTQVHKQIAALLAALRECRANPNAKPYPAPKRSGGSGGGGGGQF